MTENLDKNIQLTEKLIGQCADINEKIKLYQDLLILVKAKLEETYAWGYRAFLEEKIDNIRISIKLLNVSNQ
jgi:hypothetical protein